MQTSTALAAPPAVAHAAATPRPSFELVGDLAAVEPLWRELEANGIASPYQRYDWVRAYIDAHGASPGFEARCLILREPGGQPLLLLPLAIRRTPGGRIADVVGDKHANFHGALMRPGAGRALRDDDARAALIEAGRWLGIDAYAFTNVAPTWRGEPNPLGAGGTPSPSNGYKLTLDRDPEATLSRALSKDTRKKLRRKEKALEAIGPVAHRVAREDADVDAMLDTFLRLKRERFRELGIANPFDDPATQRFLRSGCRAGLERGAPAIELHALSVGDRIAAVFGAAADATRCSGMMIAFDPEPAIARSSPGDLLLTHVIRAQCAAGRETFDLGVGEARYKSSLCDETEPLVDVFIPVSWRGRLHAVAASGLGAAKRRVKQTPWMWRAVGAARKLKARAASAAAEA